MPNWLYQSQKSDRASVPAGSKVIAEYDACSVPANPTKEYVYTGSKMLATVTGTGVTCHHPDQSLQLT